jgi:hypothetical protein
VRWSWLWTFLGLCLLAAAVAGPAVDLPHAGVAAAVAEIPRPAQASASLGQMIILGQLPDTMAGQRVRWTASLVIATPRPVGTGLAVPFRSSSTQTCEL